MNCPVFLLSGTSGEFEQEFVIPFDQMLEMYNRMNVPKVMARRTGMTHDDMTSNALSGTSGEFEQEFVIPFDQMLEMYNRMNVPKVMARRTGMTHDDMTSNAQGYVIAWMKWQLQNDREAARVFTGSSPELLSNDRYKDVKIDLDGMK